jgi:hypothetical protein
MGRIWSVARHTLAEAVRMKVAVICIVILAAIIFGLPFISKGDGSISGAVQSFLTYSLVATSFLLSCLSIFLAKSLSDDLVGKQILIVMTKPIARWQYVLGKWLGIMVLNMVILTIVGVAIYGMTMYLAGRLRGLIVIGAVVGLLALAAAFALVRGLRPVRPTAGKWAGLATAALVLVALGGVSVAGLYRYQKTFQPRDEYDGERLRNQILQARHSQRFRLPTQEFGRRASEIYNKNVAEGKYSGVSDLNEHREKARIREEIEQQWRTVETLGGRVFEISDVRCSRKPDELLHLKYQYRCYRYPPDEIIRSIWYAGNREKGTQLYVFPRRDVLDRRHTLPMPADAVAPDGTLTLAFENRNPFVGDPDDPEEVQHDNPVTFEGPDAVEVLFAIGTFGGNLTRALALVLCRLAFLAALSVAAATLLSFPVAALASLTVYTLAVARGFLGESITWIGTESVGRRVTQGVLQNLLNLLYVIIPNFAEFDGLPTLVDGRNVTLRWVLQGIGQLGMLQAGVLLLLGCLIFHRREVAEISV